MSQPNIAVIDFSAHLSDQDVQEVLELIIDPTVNIFVPGPDPRNASNTVLHTYEVCDAVERTSYEIDGIRVYNFLTPTYFTIGDESGTRNDFLGVGVPSFGVTQGSHIAFFDLSTGTFETVIGQQEARLMVQAKRAKLFDHPKPDRPGEARLARLLTKYNNNPAKGCKGLEHLGGLTRTGRYQSAALRMKK